MVGTIGNGLVMEIGWTDVGSEGYILVSCAHSNTKTWSELELRSGFLNGYILLSPAIHKGILDSFYILCFSQKKNTKSLNHNTYTIK
jgi:hypothetical protein